MRYDNNGNVTQKTVDGTTTTYVYDYANRFAYGSMFETTEHAVIQSLFIGASTAVAGVAMVRAIKRGAATVGAVA
jgi:hypothetical protein